jgi:hypothetical protein
MKEMNFKNLIFVFLALFQVYDCQPTEIYANRLQITNINDQFVLYWKLVNTLKYPIPLSSTQPIAISAPLIP